MVVNHGGVRHVPVATVAAVAAVVGVFFCLPIFACMSVFALVIAFGRRLARGCLVDFGDLAIGVRAGSALITVVWRYLNSWQPAKLHPRRGVIILLDWHVR